MRQAHDSLQFMLEKKRKKLKDLQVQADRIQKQHTEQEPDKNIREMEEELMQIDESRVVHDLESEQLHHMYLTYKADILSQQIKIQNLKESLKESKKLRERLSHQYEHTRQQCFKYWDRAVHYVYKNEASAPALEEDLPGEDDLTDQVTEFQGRSVWNYIEKREKELDGIEQGRLEQIRQRQKQKALQKRWDLAESKRHDVKGMEHRIQYKKENVERLMKHMNVGRSVDILKNYEELIKNKDNLKDILIHYKKRVEEVEVEIQELQKEYATQKYEVDDTPSRYDTPAYILKVKSMLQEYESHSDPKESSKGEPTEISKIRERLETFMKNKNDKPEEKEDGSLHEHKEDEIEKPQEVKEEPEQVVAKPAFKEEALQTQTSSAILKEANGFDTDALVTLEALFSKSFKDLLKKEAEVKRMSNLINNSCLTVSRVIYQLESNVTYFNDRKM